MAKRSIGRQEKDWVKEETLVFEESETSIDLNALLGFFHGNVRRFFTHTHTYTTDAVQSPQQVSTSNATARAWHFSLSKLNSM